MTKIIIIVIWEGGIILPKGFSNDEKNVIVEKLLEQCRTNWKVYGYKKTSIDMICQNTGISKGAFYIFFESKEALFYQVIKQIQAQLYKTVEEHLSKNPNKYALAEALKEVYAQYCENSFIYDTKSTDFQGFLNKLNPQQRNELNDISYNSTKFMLNKPFLKLKIEEELAISILSVMLSSISQKNDMLCDANEVFAFMIDNLIDDIFE